MRSFQHSVTIEQAHRLFDAGDLRQAELLCRQILKADKGDLKAVRLLGMVAFANGDADGAVNHFKKCLAKAPQAAIIHHDIAQIRLQQGRYDEAMSGFNQALKHKPAYGQAIAGKANILEREGDREAAMALLAPHVEAGGEDIYMATVMMKLLDAAGKQEAAIEIARRHVDRPRTDEAQRRMMLMELGRLHDKRREYDRAFDAFTQANRHNRPFSRAAYVEMTDGLIEAFSEENLRALPRSSIASELPIFIACMPRSGSTLVDQIVHSHPLAYGAGELDTLNEQMVRLRDRLGTLEAYPFCVPEVTAAHLDDIGAIYLQAISRLNRSARRITNKHLHNYKHMGMISLVFPKARVIHIHREPIDNCLGMYMAALDINRYPWVADFRNLGLVYRQYQRLMKHWRKVLDVPFLDVKYEDLVENPDLWIRRIIEFSGLPWDDQCLRYYETDRAVLTLSYDQVRKPIFKSAVNRAEKYAAFLGPLKAALAGEVEPDAR